MKKRQNYISSILFLAAAISLSCISNASAQADASADLAAIGTLSVQAKANLAIAALGGDVNAIAEASKRSDAVDAAMAQAQEAFSALEAAIASSDAAAVQAATDTIAASKQKATDALNGVIPESMVNEIAEWRASNPNTGGGPGDPYDPPNMFDKPWQTVGMRNFYASQFGSFWASGRGTGDTDATPE